MRRAAICLLLLVGCSSTTTVIVTPTATAPSPTPTPSLAAFDAHVLELAGEWGSGATRELCRTMNQNGLSLTRRVFIDQYGGDEHVSRALFDLLASRC